jgi:hypothetical protein
VSSRTPLPRLAILFAREAERAVIFRRGPSKQVELLQWDVSRDKIAKGHWFKGRIYERRCDLSPDGRYLVYFAKKHNASSNEDDVYTYSWTAISRPPFLTALALWPKGNSWHGGGLFRSNSVLELNHRLDRAVPHPGHVPSERLTVIPDPNADGEDDPIYSRRLERDGWQLRQAWKVEFGGIDGGYKTPVPEVRERVHPKGYYTIVASRRIEGYASKETFQVEGARGPVPLALQRPSWVDWDQRGRLVALHGGGVWAAKVTRSEIGEFSRVADLTNHRFENRKTPPWALEW